MQDQDRKEKLKELMSLAEEKGAEFAIEQAKKTKDPVLLDLLHDEIIEKGLSQELF